MADENTTLVKLDKATQMLSEAKSLDDVKHILDIAEAARVYAKAAKLGLEAQNHAAEVKLRAERKAGEMLGKLEKDKGGRPKTVSSLECVSEYREVLNEQEIPNTTAHRWQQINEIPEDTFEQHITETQARHQELTTTGVMRKGKELRREQSREANRALVNEIKPIATLDKYQTIVIDPPWDWGDEGDIDQLGTAKPSYATMPIDEIALLPIPKLSANNAHIYLWITNRSLPKGFGLLAGWGFRYVTMLTWVKPSCGVGNYFRGSTEQILFGVKGSLPLLRSDVGTHFMAPRPGKHSGKPDAFFDLVETCSPGPWLEMFSRKERAGWVSWGAEV